MTDQDATKWPSSRPAAKALGVKRFFTGRPCKVGHVAPRYADNGACVECMKAHVAASRKKATKARKEKKAMKVIHVPAVDCVIVAAEPMNAEQSEAFRRGLIEALERGPWPPATGVAEALLGDSAVLIADDVEMHGKP